LRKRDLVVVWPAYFDSTKTCSSGRRTPKRMSVPSPSIKEILAAAKRLGLECREASEKRYPRFPRDRTGSVLITRIKPKSQILKDIAKELRNT